MEKFAVLGLGYVGLPLALSLSKNTMLLIYNKIRITDLNNGKDINNEFSGKELKKKYFIYL